ncbi:uncharacterized protein LOC117630536 [Prunus dulcis]|uniref:uncharacterized protein LOC117630536 n=1 Tax=Prunus dulcis TaxID=3755 RepID=UPI0014831932|nr:uncharacterized protein LOC117630536 [Prunus dulcis]
MVIAAFGIAGEGEPSYEQFSYLYSITKSKSADHGGWVQANCLKASERGHFISSVPTSQKSWRNRRGLLSGDWESPSGVVPRFPVPTTFQTTVTDARKAAEDKKMNESSRRGLMMGLEKKKKKQPEAPAVRLETDPEDVVLSERLRQLGSEPVARPTAEVEAPRQPDADAAASRAAGKRPVMVDLEASPVSKRSRPSEASRAVFAAEDEDGPTEAVTIACPSKTVQFVKHMILGSQMELPEVDELPKRLLLAVLTDTRNRSSASMEMWLCVKRAISAAERVKKAYDDGRAKVAEAGKAIQDHAHLLKEKEAAERQAFASEAKAEQLRVALEAARADLEVARSAARDAEAVSEAIQDAMQESERNKAAEVEAAKLNLNFAADPPPLPEGITEEMIEDYEGEDAAEGPGTADAAAGDEAAA